MGTKKPTQSPRTDSKFTANRKPKVEWQGYVNFEISKEQKTALNQAIKNNNDPLLWLPQIAADGVYEIKAKWDSYNNCWVATIYCAKYGHDNAGWALPCRAADFWDSLRRVAFVHSEVLQGEWHVTKLDNGWDDEKW